MTARPAANLPLITSSRWIGWDRRRGSVPWARSPFTASKRERRRRAAAPRSPTKPLDAGGDRSDAALAARTRNSARKTADAPLAASASDADRSAAKYSGIERRDARARSAGRRSGRSGGGRRTPCPRSSSSPARGTDRRVARGSSRRGCGAARSGRVAAASARSCRRPPRRAAAWPRARDRAPVDVVERRLRPRGSSSSRSPSLAATARTASRTDAASASGAASTTNGSRRPRRRARPRDALDLAEHLGGRRRRRPRRGPRSRPRCAPCRRRTARRARPPCPRRSAGRRRRCRPGRRPTGPGRAGGSRAGPPGRARGRARRSRSRISTTPIGSIAVVGSSRMRTDRDPSPARRRCRAAGACPASTCRSGCRRGRSCRPARATSSIVASASSPESPLRRAV